MDGGTLQPQNVNSSLKFFRLTFVSLKNISFLACDCHIYCYEEDTDYEGDDIGGNIYTNIANAHDCQAKCHLNKDCLYWSFMDPSMNHKWAGNCWLKDGKGTVKSFSGVTSGPKYCSKYQVSIKIT